MSLSAVALMAGHVGCVCRPTSGPDGATASIAGGMTTVMLQQAASRQQQAAASSQRVGQ